MGGVRWLITTTRVLTKCTTFPPDLTLDRYKKIHTSKASSYPNFSKAPYPLPVCCPLGLKYKSIILETRQGSKNPGIKS